MFLNKREKSITSHFAVSFFKPILTTGVFMFLSSTCAKPKLYIECLCFTWNVFTLKSITQEWLKDTNNSLFFLLLLIS